MPLPEVRFKITILAYSEERGSKNSVGRNQNKIVLRITYRVSRLFPPHPNPLPPRGEGIKILYLSIHSMHCILFSIMVSEY